MPRGIDLSLQERIDRLGLTEVWRQVAGWAEASKHGEALDGIVTTLEGAWWAQIEDYEERKLVVKIAGRSRDVIKNTPAEPGAAARAEALRKELIAAIERGNDLARYDSRIYRAGPHLLAARRILAEPADPSNLVREALASRKRGRPRQHFNRAVVERTLTAQLIAIAPADVTRAEAQRLATKLLMKLFT